MKVTFTKIILIAILSVSFIAIFSKDILAVSTSPELASNAQTNTEQANSQVEIGQTVGQNEEEKKRYTIEDIVYNRVPILDVNIFSNNAGGQPVVEGSVTYVIRNIVATWYVSMRNVIAVILMILLVYSGLRMSIATVASTKANYKLFLMGWLKSIIILFTIHFIIALIFNINDMLVTFFSKGASNENELYETIRTRAHDIRFTVGIPGMFMYITLIFMFVKFAWMYVKRYFTIIILIIMAPFTAGKYAYDSASGKRSNVFSSWLYQFTTNVIIQSAHALLYTCIVGVALQLSLNNLTSFIVALVFLNFMLSADKIVLRLFKFTDNLDELHRPFKKEEQLAGVFYAYGAYKTAIGVTKGGIKAIGNVASSGIETLGKVTGNDYKEKIDDTIKENLDKLDRDILAKSENLSNSNKIAKNIINPLRQTLILRIASRRKGMTGRIARQTLRLKKAQRKATFKSNYKFILSEIQGIGSVVIGVPVMVLSPTAGIGVIASGVKKVQNNGKQEKLRKWTIGQKTANVVTLGAYGNRLEAKEKREKTDKEIGTLVNAVNNSHTIITNIETEVKGLKNEEEIKQAKQAMKDVNKLRTESSNIRKHMQRYMLQNNIKDVKDMSEDERKDMILDVTTKTGVKDVMTDKEQQRMNIFINDKIEGRNGNSKFTDIDVDKMSTLISETITKSCIKNKFTNLGIQINKLKDNEKAVMEAAYQATEEDDNEMIDINRFIDNL